LLIDAGGPDAAVAFLSSASRYPADITKVLVNKPSELLILVPNALTPGSSYDLTITTDYSPSGKLLKNPHTATFDTPLTAVAPASHDDGEPVI
jgi:hypothetical protein